MEDLCKIFWRFYEGVSEGFMEDLRRIYGEFLKEQ